MFYDFDINRVRAGNSFNFFSWTVLPIRSKANNSFSLNYVRRSPSVRVTQHVPESRLPVFDLILTLSSSTTSPQARRIRKPGRILVRQPIHLVLQGYLQALRTLIFPIPSPHDLLTITMPFYCHYRSLYCRRRSPWSLFRPRSLGLWTTARGLAALCPVMATW